MAKARTTKQRSAAAKVAWKKRKSIMTAKDVYSNLTELKPKIPDQGTNDQSNFLGQLDRRTPYEKFVKSADSAEEQLRISVFETTKEETREDLEMALYHLRIVNRFAKKAYTI